MTILDNKHQALLELLHPFLKLHHHLFNGGHHLLHLHPFQEDQFKSLKKLHEDQIRLRLKLDFQTFPFSQSENN